MTTDVFRRNHGPVLSSIMTCHRICNNSDTTGVTSGTGTVYPSGAPMLTPVCSVVRVTRSFVFCVVFCIILFDLFLLAITLSVLHFTASDDSFWYLQALLDNKRSDM